MCVQGRRGTVMRPGSAFPVREQLVHNHVCDGGFTPSKDHLFLSQVSLLILHHSVMPLKTLSQVCGEHPRLQSTSGTSLSAGRSVEARLSGLGPLQASTTGGLEIPSLVVLEAGSLQSGGWGALLPRRPEGRTRPCFSQLPRAPSFS